MIVQARARAAAHIFTTEPNEGDPNLVCAYVEETSGHGFKKAFLQFVRIRNGQRSDMRSLLR